jgi:hypothetical protein
MSSISSMSRGFCKRVLVLKRVQAVKGEPVGFRRAAADLFRKKERVAQPAS